MTRQPYAEMIPEQPSPETGSDDDVYRRAYAELKRIARASLRGRGRVALDTTELVHEAYLKLASSSDREWDGRAHFFGAAARAMRQVLVDFARRRRAQKRGGAWRAVTLDSAHAALEVELDDVLALDAALDRLDGVDSRLRRVVELRFFGGVPELEIARMLGVSSRTVERDWLKAKLFLLDELKPDPGSGRAPSPEAQS